MSILRLVLSGFPSWCRSSVWEVWILFLFIGILPASAQTVSPAEHPAPDDLTWHLLADGKPVEEFDLKPYPADSLEVVARQALSFLQQAGYSFAKIDSVAIDTTQTPPEGRLFATQGPAVVIGQIDLTGITALDSLEVRALMETRMGRPLNADRLEADLQAILMRYEQRGFPLVQAYVQEITLLPETPPRLHLILHIDEGRSLVLRRLELPQTERTRPRFVARVAGIREGQPLRSYDPVAIQQRLEATGLFESVEPPELFLDPEGDALMRIRLKEEPPGTFDLVLGYLPGTQGNKGSLVGNGHLSLRNLMGEGRALSLKLNRLPGQVSSVDVRAGDPYLLGLPFSVEAHFQGHQQDSTFGKQGYGLEAGYHLSRGLQLLGTLKKEATRPGEAGLRLIGQQQRVPRADALFVGLGVRLQQLDRRINPRKGIFFETNLEEGYKNLSMRVVTTEENIVLQHQRIRQQRLSANGRLYIPTFARQVLVVGGETNALFSDEFDQSDLFRFGGATSLRGYDEARFLVPLALRALIEYRYQIDRTSYAFLFFDLGYVERKETEAFADLRGFYPGYGLGFQVGTEAGIINLSLAGNPDEPAGVRAHLGLSLGL